MVQNKCTAVQSRKNVFLALTIVLILSSVGSCDSTQDDTLSFRQPGQTEAMLLPTSTPPPAPTPEKLSGDILDELSRQGLILLGSIDEKTKEYRNLTNNELKKLVKTEYRVISKSIDTPDEGLEKEMNTLGEEGWKCLLSEQKYKPGYLISCQRSARSASRYLKILELLR